VYSFGRHYSYPGDTHLVVFAYFGNEGANFSITGIYRRDYFLFSHYIFLLGKFFEGCYDIGLVSFVAWTNMTKMINGESRHNGISVGLIDGLCFGVYWFSSGGAEIRATYI
jgi:hypothetical protein